MLYGKQTFLIACSRLTRPRVAAKPKSLASKSYCVMIFLRVLDAARQPQNKGIV